MSPIVTARRAARILLVDDHEPNRQTLALTLERAGFCVVQASSGREALSDAAHGADLIVLGVHLPDIDGYDVCRRLRANAATNATPVVMVSASCTTLESKLRGLDGGADAYLAQPFDPAELVALANALLRARDVDGERFRALIEHSNELVAIVDPDSTFRYASQSYRTILGFDPEQLLGTPALAIVHPDDVDECRRSLAEAHAASGAVVSTCLRVIDAGGNTRVIEISRKNMLDHPAVHGIVCNGRDVTGSRNADEELRFRAHLLDTVQQAVIATNADGTIRYWNAHAERLYGWRADEVAGRNIVDVTPSEATREQAADIMRRLTSGESWAGEFMVQARDGRRFPAHVTDSPIRDDAGNIVGIVGVSKDISERRALEEQLRQSQKLEGIGKLAGGIAHDFNNLLTVIRGNAEFVACQMGGESAPNADLAELIAAADRAAALTRQLLAFSRKQMLKPEVLNLNDVIRDVERLLGRLIGEDVALVLRLADDLSRVHADRGQVEQVLMNLAVNARDAMPSGGTLAITTANIEFGDDSGRPADLPRGAYAMFTVADTGHGMEREILERAFEPFFTTKAAGAGTGLGLATVYGIVRQSRGHVTAVSEPGKGSAFTVYLPRYAVSDARERRTATTAPARGGETILLVEDEEGVRLIARRILERHGYAVIEARNGREAAELLADAAVDVQLVISDVVMPDMGGGELIEFVRRTRPSLPALLTSGYTEDEFVRRGLDAATRFLEKPFTPATLAAAVREVLDASARPARPSIASR